MQILDKTSIVHLVKLEANPFKDFILEVGWFLQFILLSERNDFCTNLLVNVFAFLRPLVRFVYDFNICT